MCRLFSWKFVKILVVCLTWVKPPRSAYFVYSIPNDVGERITPPRLICYQQGPSYISYAIRYLALTSNAPRNLTVGKMKLPFGKTAYFQTARFLVVFKECMFYDVLCIFFGFKWSTPRCVTPKPRCNMFLSNLWHRPILYPTAPSNLVGCFNVPH